MNKFLKSALIILPTLFVLTSGYHFFFGTTVTPKTVAEFSKTSVMITRYDGRSGGTGVIISSHRNESKILTNAHVCHVVQGGGIVRSDDKKAMVKYYQVSNVHDLCLITVSTNFKVSTILAKEEPDVYDDAIVSGHPHLLENIVTRGHFSGKQMVNVLIEIRPCSFDEAANPENGVFCGILGGMPVIRTYEAQVISNTIQPGSSGSAVFNHNGELSGLVFAGSGDFGYGMIVPYEYVANFFDSELLAGLPEIVPNESQSSPVVVKTDWKKVCTQNVGILKIMSVCELVNKSLLLGQ